MQPQFIGLLLVLTKDYWYNINKIIKHQPSVCSSIVIRFLELVGFGLGEHKVLGLNPNHYPCY